MDAATSESQPNPPKQSPRGRQLALVGAGLIALAIAGGAWMVGNYYSRRAESYTKVTPRIGKNAPFIKTPDLVVDQMVEMSGLKPGDVAYDLGCGDGRIIITAALKTGCRGVGFDIDPKRVAEARENVRLHGVEDLVEIRQQDVFTVDLRGAKVVLMYLLPWMNQKLVPQFRQMKPGSRVIAHDFNLGDAEELKPEKTVTVTIASPSADGQSVEHLVHRWIMPLRAPADRNQP
jgi:SAM-dependent methyltransferase